MDGFGVEQDATHSIKFHKFPTLILKLDLVKAYGKVDRPFLRIILLKIGVGLETTNLIMGCVNYYNFIV